MLTRAAGRRVSHFFGHRAEAQRPFGQHAIQFRRPAPVTGSKLPVPSRSVGFGPAASLFSAAAPVFARPMRSSSRSSRHLMFDFIFPPCHRRRLRRRCAGFGRNHGLRLTAVPRNSASASTFGSASFRPTSAACRSIRRSPVRDLRSRPAVRSPPEGKAGPDWTQTSETPAVSRVSSRPSVG